jgi:hypothetical protein
MRRLYLFVLILGGVIIVAVIVRTGFAAGGRKPGPVYVTPPASVVNHIISHTPESTPEPDGCGPWSSSDGSVGGPLSQKYGELRNCLFFDNSWIILTEGLVEQNGTRLSGVVAVYRCEPTDVTCVNGQEDHPLSGWQIYQPPCPGSLSAGANSLPGKLQLMGTCASYFEVATGTFSNK